jgi:hypothetical protein
MSPCLARGVGRATALPTLFALAIAYSNLSEANSTRFLHPTHEDTYLPGQDYSEVLRCTHGHTLAGWCYMFPFAIGRKLNKPRLKMRSPGRISPDPLGAWPLKLTASEGAADEDAIARVSEVVVGV